MEKLFIVLILFLFFVSFISSSSTSTSLNIVLNRIIPKSNYTTVEHLQLAVRSSRRRMEALHSKLTDIANTQIKVNATAGEDLAGGFYASFKIGNPGVPQFAILDTGSDLIWTQCKPCIKCYHSELPIYDPSLSSTFSYLPCTSPLCMQPQTNSTCTQCVYRYFYAGASSTAGVLAVEDFTFIGITKNTTANKLLFGCARENNMTAGRAASGIIGLGPSPWSLVSQLGIGNFSYCLTPFNESNVSLMTLGSTTGLNGTGVQSTPLKFQSQSHYYVNLGGISLGSTHLHIPINTFQSGLIIDSGTTITYLVQPAFDAINREILSIVNLRQINAIDGFTCFDLKGGALPEMPDMIFHLDGANLTLPIENYMFTNFADGYSCLMINSSGSLSISILGNIQQQNMNIFYDIANKLLYFEPAQCAQLK